MHSFDSTDGANPLIGVIVANDGNIYGATENGSGGGGNIFQITPQGVFASLYSFCNATGCTGANGNTVFQATNGVLYGDTEVGGASGDGIVYSFNNNLSPLVETVPTAGPVGEHVIILGNELRSATSVTFNGTVASFTVVSDSEIRATVPAGATSGPVSVVTRTGTLNSNPSFVITK